MRLFKTLLVFSSWSALLALALGCTVQEANFDTVVPVDNENSTHTEELNLDSLWARAEPISDDILEICSEAIKGLGSNENRSCSYVRVTVPCDDCEDEPTRRSIYALRHSLLQPGIKALMEWFDTPATHTVSKKIEEKYDASREPPWTLLKLDDVAPTEVERYSHYQEKIALFSSVEQKRARREDRNPVGEIHPAAMKVWFEPLVPTHYLGTEDGQLYVGAKPNRKSKSTLTKHLQLTLAINPKTRQLSMFDQRSRRGFVPHFGLRVREVKFQGIFELDPNIDAVVLKQFEYSFRVRLTALFPSSNKFSHRYTNFECQKTDDSVKIEQEGS